MQKVIFMVRLLMYFLKKKTEKNNKNQEEVSIFGPGLT